MFIKLVRLGKDADLRYTQDQTPLLELACAYDVGYGDNKKTQWVQAVLWGKRAENLCDYLKKGTQIMLIADDLELEQYQTNDGRHGAKLKCKVVDINFASNKAAATHQPEQPAPQAAPQQPQQPQAGDQNFDQFDDDIPF